MGHNDGPSRRGFLAASAGLTLAGLGAASAPGDRSCILLWLTGGPSQLDTFDLKPDAPSDIRGPFRPIKTNAPGVEVCVHLPLLATRADRFALLRSVHHDAPPVHETGHQLMQTGRLCREGDEQPHMGAVLSRLLGPRVAGVPAWAVVPGALGYTGLSVSHGQTAGPLGAEHGPYVPERLDLGLESAARYGNTAFGRSCLAARRLVERGTRFVTVNMAATVFNEVTWDCHADGGSLATTLDDYRRTLLPTFDRALSALLDDLSERGMLASTLVVAAGEFGRTPHLNARGGRDHWPGVWTVLFAGAGVKGGQAVGASDRLGGEPKDRPATPADVVATVYHALGVDPARTLPGGRRLADGRPVSELFGG